MTFLNPGAGLLALCIGVPALLLLYFLKLRRRPLRVSATFLWQQAAQDLQVNVPFRFIRPSWLLALQLLAVLALCAAIGRPALDAGGGAPKRVLLLIDRSASMSAMDGLDEQGRTCSRLDEAKRRARATADALLSRAGRSTQVSVAALAATTGAVSPASQNAATVREAVDSLSPTDQPGDLDAAIRFAQAMAMDTLSEDGAPEPLTVILFSDGGFAPASAPVTPGKGLALRYERVGPRPPSPEEGQPAAMARRDNAGIVAISSRRDYDDPSSLRVFVRVQNADARPRPVTVRLTLDGAAAGERVLDVPGAAPAVGGAPPAPGEAGVTFNITGRQGGVALATVLEPDLLASDNLAGLVIAPAAEARVLLVAPGASGRDADPFLANVLGSMDDASVRTVDAATYEQIAAGLDGGGIGSQFDLIVFDRIEPVRLPRSVPSVSLGAGLPGLARVEPVAGEDAVRFASWRRDHPVLRYVHFDSVVVQPPMRMALTSPDGAARPVILADGPGGPLMALVEDAAGVRRVVVSFALGRSNWPPMFSFPVFLQNCVDFLTLRAEAAGGRAFSTISPLVVSAQPGVKEIALVRAADADLPAAAPVLSAAVPPSQGTRAVALGRVERAGLYYARGGLSAVGTPADARGVPIAVNLTDPVESMLRVAEAVDLPGGALAAGTGGGAPREVWHWFVLAALAVLSVEWFVYAWRMRM